MPVYICGDCDEWAKRYERSTETVMLINDAMLGYRIG